MSGTAAADRAAWLDHYHRCLSCQGKRPCPPGRYLIAAMRATMVAEESLPEWMSPAPIGLRRRPQAGQDGGYPMREQLYRV